MLNIFKKNTIFGRNTNSDLPLYYDNITVEGKTTQETSTQGANLFDENYYRNATYDITTAYSSIETRFKGNRTLYIKSKLKSGKTRQSGIYACICSTRNPNISGSVFKWFMNNGYVMTDSVDFTGYENLYFDVYPKTTEAIAQVFDNYDLWVSTDNINYEPFVPDMPSPDYPSELVSVGYENLIENKLNTTTQNGITITKNNDGTYTLNGTATTDIAFRLDQSSWNGVDNLKNYDAGTYTFSCPELQNDMQLVLMQNETWTILGRMENNGTPVTFSTESYKNCFIYVWAKSGKTINNLTITPQLEKGNKAHSFIPYGKYGIEVKTTGKNLFDSENWYNTLHNLNNESMTKEVVNGIEYYKFLPNGIWNYQYMLGKFKENTQYTLTCKARQYDDITVYSTGFTFVYTDGTHSSGQIELTKTEYDYKLTSLPNKTISYIRLGYAYNRYVLVRNVQLKEGTQLTTYEPFMSHINLITLNEPLRSIGDTKDLLYIKNGMLYVERKIGSKVLNGSESWVNWAFTSDEYIGFLLDNYIDYDNSTGTDIRGMANYFEVTVGGNINKDNLGMRQMGDNLKRIYVCISKDLITSIANFKTWLSTHNTEVQYELATPTIETYELDIQPMIFDSLGYGTLSDVVSDPLITEELNGSYILELEYMKNGKFSEYLVEENIIKAHGEPFSIYSVEKDTDEKIKILAKHWVINEWDKDFILDSAPTDLTAQNALAWIQQRSINHSDISISGDCTTTSTARYVRKNMLSAIFKEDNAILTRFGGELSYNKNNVSVNKHRGSLSGLTIRQGKNLTGAKYYLDFSTVTTRLVPVGKDGLMLDEVYVDSPLINNYATPIIRKVEVNTTSKDELRSYCNKLYENGLDKPTVSIKIDFIELSKTDEYKQYSSLETAHLGDEVTAYIPSLNLNVSTRIVKTVYNDNLKRITALELGSVTPNIATSSVNVEKNLQKQVEQLAANDSLILDEAKEEASNLIKHPFGGYIYIDETTGNMYIMDTNNINTAQNVWRWGLGGLGFSSTGVNGTYGIAMTQDGKIVADYIKSGTLQSVTIKATNGTVGGYKIGENKLYAETYSSYNFDSSDLTAIRNYLMDEGSLSDDELIKYDIDGNGVVDSRDYVLIRNFIELGVTKNKSAKIIMQTGNNIFENAYILQDANENDILNINFNGFIYDHPNNGKFNLSGSKLTLTDINNNSMTISPNWLPKSVLSNWYSTSSTTLTDAKKHKLLVILGKPTSSSGIVSLIIPTDALSTSNQQFQCADESKYVAFNVRYNNDDVIITGAGRSSDGSILSAWTLL